MKTVLITGTNRGLGLALVDTYLARGWRVIATCRKPDKAESLRARSSNAALSILELDVAIGDSVRNLAANLDQQTIDMLIHNAGIGGPTPGFLPFDRDFWVEAAMSNAVGPMHLTAEILPLLRRGQERKIVAISSFAGSIAATTGGFNAYRSSKAALNMGMRTLAQELADEQFKIVAISPGVIDTDMARDVQSPKIAPRDGAEALANFIDTLDPTMNGGFFRPSGEVLPW